MNPNDVIDAYVGAVVRRVPGKQRDGIGLELRGLLGEMQRMAELEEVDSALLSDDLPIDAYLDQGFDAWVQNDLPE